MVKAHKNDTKTFDELTFTEQAQSINAQIQNLKKAIIAHEKRALLEGKPTNDFIKSIVKMLASI